MAHFVSILAVALLSVKHCTAVDPTLSIVVLGAHVDTATIVEKLESALYNYDRTFGRLIYFKKNDGCLDSAKECGGNWYCLFPSRTCNFDNPTQQWRMVDHRLEVASKQHLPRIDGAAPCLDCFLGQAECEFTIRSCLANDVYQQYFVRVHPHQIDFTKKRIYFSIHNKGFPTKCLTDTFNVHNNIETFKLAECTGSDEQSFYIGINLDKEIEEVRTKVIGSGSLLLE